MFMNVEGPMFFAYLNSSSHENHDKNTYLLLKKLTEIHSSVEYCLDPIHLIFGLHRYNSTFIAYHIERRGSSVGRALDSPLWLPAHYWLGWCQYNVTVVWQHVKLSDVSLGTLRRYSPVVDEDFKKLNNETNKQTNKQFNKLTISVTLKD